MAELSGQSIYEVAHAKWAYFYAHTILPSYIKPEDLKIVLNWSFQQVVITLTTHIAGEPVTEIKYPKDWWQAVKERFFPGWLKEKFPVQYEVWKVSFIYPEMERREPRPEILIHRDPNWQPKWS